MKTNVTVRIMDSDFPLMCEADEKDVLIKSAELLNQQLKAFRRKNPSLDMEKVLMMGALRSTVELYGEIERLSDQAKIVNGEVMKTVNFLAED